MTQHKNSKIVRCQLSIVHNKKSLSSQSRVRRGDEERDLLYEKSLMAIPHNYGVRIALKHLEFGIKVYIEAMRLRKRD